MSDTAPAGCGSDDWINSVLQVLLGDIATAENMLTRVCKDHPVFSVPGLVRIVLASIVGAYSATPVTVLFGSAGTGKSHTLHALHQRAELLFPQLTVYEELRGWLRGYPRVVSLLRRIYNDSWDGGSLTDSELLHNGRALLHQAAAGGGVVLLLDDIDSLLDPAAGLPCWLPFPLPPGLRVIGTAKEAADNHSSWPAAHMQPHIARRTLEAPSAAVGASSETPRTRLLRQHLNHIQPEHCADSNSDRVLVQSIIDHAADQQPLCTTLLALLAASTVGLTEQELTELVLSTDPDLVGTHQQPNGSAQQEATAGVQSVLRLLGPLVGMRPVTVCCERVQVWALVDSLARDAVVGQAEASSELLAHLLRDKNKWTSRQIEEIAVQITANLEKTQCEGVEAESPLNKLSEEPLVQAFLTDMDVISHFSKSHSHDLVKLWHAAGFDELSVRLAERYNICDVSPNVRHLVGKFLNSVGAWAAARRWLTSANTALAGEPGQWLDRAEVLNLMATNEICHWDSMRNWRNAEQVRPIVDYASEAVRILKQHGAPPLRPILWVQLCCRCSAAVLTWECNAATRKRLLPQLLVGTNLFLHLVVEGLFMGVMSALNSCCFKTACVGPNRDALMVWLDRADDLIVEACTLLRECQGVQAQRVLGDALLIGGVTMAVRGSKQRGSEQQSTFQQAVGIFYEADCQLQAARGPWSTMGIFSHSNLSEIYLSQTNGHEDPLLGLLHQYIACVSAVRTYGVQNPITVSMCQGFARRLADRRFEIPTERRQALAKLATPATIEQICAAELVLHLERSGNGAPSDKSIQILAGLLSSGKVDMDYLNQLSAHMQLRALSGLVCGNV